MSTDAPPYTITLPPADPSDQNLAALMQFAVENAFKSKTFHEAVRKVVYECAPQLSRNMEFMLQIAESLKAARWTAENIPLHRRFTHETLRREALMLAPNDGLHLEFGVWRGHWLRRMAAMKPVTFHGFDSFEGIPAEWSLYGKNHFNLKGQLPEVPDNVRLVKGWFNESLPPFLAGHGEPVSFIHMDCDLYSSTETVLELIRPRLRVGTTMVMDDFFIEPGWDQAEFKAFHDFVKKHGMEFEFIGYVTDTPGTAVGVKFTKV